jgi:hypothetical protein
MKLKVLVLLSLILSFTSATFSQTKKPLANDDVLQMVKAGFPESMITKAIDANDTNFDVSVQALMELKNGGVSQPVIDAMLSAEAKKKAPEAAAKPAKEPPPDPNDPKSPHESGIYWLSKNGTGSRMIRLEVSSYSQSKTGGLMASGMTMGIHKVKWKAVLPGPHAALRINEATPEFWFYFDEKSQGLGQSSVRPEASRPEEFALTKMSASGKERQLVVGQASITGGSTGTRPGDTIPVNVEKVAPGIYKVTTSKALDPAEYCFVPPSGAVGYGMAGGTLFDFGIDKAQ